MSQYKSKKQTRRELDCILRTVLYDAYHGNLDRELCANAYKHLYVIGGFRQKGVSAETWQDDLAPNPYVLDVQLTRAARERLGYPYRVLMVRTDAGIQQPEAYNTSHYYLQDARVIDKMGYAGTNETEVMAHIEKVAVRYPELKTVLDVQQRKLLEMYPEPELIDLS